LLIISAAGFTLLSAVGEGPAFYWRYGEAEVSSLEGVSVLSSGVLAGDDKISYFYRGVAEVDTGALLTYSYGGSCPAEALVILKEYLTKGYVSGLNVYRIHPPLMKLNRLFDSGEVIILEC